MQGIAAGVYTQTTDVEGEINGLLTNDRKVAKIPAAELKQIHSVLLGEQGPPRKCHPQPVTPPLTVDGRVRGQVMLYGNMMRNPPGIVA